MQLEIHPRVVANFFLDGAKIVFGSLVIGAFMPSASLTDIPWSTVSAGITVAIVFFLAANFAAHKEDLMKLKQQIK